MLNLNCEKTWDLLQSGRTKGVFQCESPLVQHWLRKIKPTNLWELSATIAIVRPGALQSGFADEYVEYRNGEKEFESFGHPLIDEILSTTEHVLLYQEALMTLGSRLAWPDLDDRTRKQNVDRLRKGVGKKDQKKLLEIGKEFTTGCIRNGVDQEVADKLFEVIKNCGRYLFNLAHSFSYAMQAYETAYQKANFPKEFFATHLSYSELKKKAKWDDIKELIRDTSYFNLRVLPPNINKKNLHFTIEGEDQIRYGLCHIKSVSASINKILGTIPEINDWYTCLKFLFTAEYGIKPRSPVAKALICTGALSDAGITRSALFNLYETMEELSDKEFDYVVENFNQIDDFYDIPSILHQCAIDCSIAKRKEMMESMAKTLKLPKTDHPNWVNHKEVYYLGTNISASTLDSKNVEFVNTISECTDDCPLWQERVLAVKVDGVRVTKTKKGQNPGQTMAMITISDDTGEMRNLPVFPEKYSQLSNIIIEGNHLVVNIKKGRGGWIIDHMNQL